MALKMTATNVEQAAPGIWVFAMPPHQLRIFGPTPNAVGFTSVVLFKNGVYDAGTHQLHFEAEDVVPLNIGTTSRVVGLTTDMRTSEALHLLSDEASAGTEFGPGDRKFLELAKDELSSDMYQTAVSLLQGVRKRSPGDLKKGLSRNFSETPDNFWYVILQPRISELSITVRGPVNHFNGVSTLEIKDDRGNTRFKVRGKDEVQDALSLIFHAIRKR
jgi:hypothetical protein